ncbi:hypothetical protein GGD56_007128 [Rhizobium mongolense]|uniref:Uncharacterized protein n=1 Tax=Rhizobium mongolense TaxID=57676 RepID=A0ABR6J0N1_9HYPH|nr:hypothetical protein [Rhizobium mongolense]
MSIEDHLDGRRMLAVLGSLRNRSEMHHQPGHENSPLRMLIHMPCADYILERVREGERIFADETTLPTLAPGSGKTTKA